MTGRAAPTPDASPRDVAVDYQSLYEEVKDSIDDYRTRERKALDEVESLKDKEEATQQRILELAMYEFTYSRMVFRE